MDLEGLHLLGSALHRRIAVSPYHRIILDPALSSWLSFEFSWNPVSHRRKSVMP
jgi:hypothetical protein